MKIPRERLEELSERWFESNREEFAEMLAAGETLVAFGDTLLAHEDVENSVVTEHETEMRLAVTLCAQDPELGGKHVKEILERAAQKLVDNHKDGFRASYEHEINQSDAA